MKIRLFLTVSAVLLSIIFFAVLLPSDIYPMSVLASDGTLSPWQFTSSMMMPRSVEGTVATQGYVYALGGTGECMLSQTTNTVEWAAINPGGTLGSWQLTSSMHSVRY